MGESQSFHVFTRLSFLCCPLSYLGLAFQLVLRPSKLFSANFLSLAPPLPSHGNPREDAMT